MRRSFLIGLLVTACAAPAFGITACGDDDDDGGGGSAASGEAKKGGVLRMLTNGDVDDALDPGYSYYQLDFIYNYAVERPVISYKPDDTKASPDLASEYPTVSKDGKTVTVKLRKGIKFAPPVNREITSADVKYALERDFLPQVANGYANSYWADLIGKDAYAKGNADEIKGLETPDKYTLIMRLSRATGAVAAQALALPGSAPVPKEYAAKYDKGKRSTYGQHVVASGPYMVKNNPKTGKVTGYQPGRRIEFVRNPNWDASTDYRPAYLDGFIYEEGTDPSVGNRRILTGQSMIGNPTDLSPPPAFLKQNLSKKDNLIPGPFTGRVRYVALNTKVKPFDDVNVRKAVAAGLDRNAMNQAFGGKSIGVVANHIITPGIEGFEEAGGNAGTGADFLKNPSGDPELAAQYMKKASFENGKYSGPELLMPVDNSTNQKAAGQVVLNSLEKLGFEMNFRPVTRDTMYAKFCGVPSSKTPICASVGWLKDFADPQTMLDPTFNGKNIVPANNVNWPQLDDPKLNKAMDDAALLIEPAERAKAWANIDRQVTATAAAIPWQWDKTVLVKSTNVKAVINQANAAWDMSFTSLK
jgi:peptide/nickel transport system substrate-binding protein